MHSVLSHQESQHEPRAKGWSYRHLWSWNLVRICPKSPPSFLPRLKHETSCIVASIARLAYSVRYVQVNVEGDYEVNFAGMHTRSRSFCQTKPNRPCRKHDHVVWYRSLRFYRMRQSSMLRTSSAKKLQRQIFLCHYTICFLIGKWVHIPSQCLQEYLREGLFDGKTLKGSRCSKCQDYG